jgi:predicted nuclease of restriction endonuclease-like (RecB) superfamily
MTNKIQDLELKNLLELFKETHAQLKAQAARSIDIALVVRNWLFGWYIVEFEQGGSDRTALYGKKLMEILAKELTVTLGKGFSKRVLEQCRRFYELNKQIAQAVPAQSFSEKEIALKVKTTYLEEFLKVIKEPNIKALSTFTVLKEVISELFRRFNLGWSHYVILMTLKNVDERRFYEIEAQANSWGYRELERQINSSLYERLALSRDKHKIRELSEKGHLIGSPEDIIKNPYILEFLNLPEHPHYSEHELETAIINKIEHFLLELGKGFLFEARQKRFTFDNDHFYVDLVFYNRLLRCYVLIDLKRDKLTHQDLGQMQMYVNYFDRFVKLENEAPTIGIVLCHRKNDAIVELTLPKDANIYSSEYQLYLPSKEELKKQIELAEMDVEKNNDPQI